MKIIAIHHAQVTVLPQQVSAAREFYCQFLGLEEIEKPQSLVHRGGFWVAVGDLQLHVGVEPVNVSPQTKQHVGYLVSDLAWWRERFANHPEVTMENAIPMPGYNRIQFRDPFGNRIEMLEQA